MSYSAIAKRLQNSGIKPEAAEHFATKNDLVNLKNELTIRMGVMMGGAIAIVTWLDKIIK